ncbi:MAG: outer membrane beta-barrel protein [Candidatus Magnetobacterium sp. LHC-1]|uniref:Outer membrane beta-barrel protein n=1 Tax=Candidatus Magnetobacterium casense TaxID=1455061 RepID=A0ABS6RW51_9BACT|nr:outer membrane beta-barrel protein [Candidatus Magnetobacterium casensis]MBF0606200.1 outer membrane beta-barrel protein [Nitrospirota bacterium]MBV6340851.1 outer membrane beta-barrel protein [Candidatus Magnetobacterium casensis]
MKRLYFTVLLVMLSVVGTFQYAAAADTGRTPFYVSAGTGLSWRQTVNDAAAKMAFKTGAEITAAIGLRLEELDNTFLQNFRFELEYARQFNKNDVVELHLMADKIEDAVGSVDVDSYSLVIYYDFPLRKLAPSVKGFTSHLSPYVGLGLGVNRSILKGLSSPSLDAFANLPTSQGGLGKNGEGYNLSTVSDFVFVISPRFGVTYEMSKHFDVYMGGKYIQSNKTLVDAYGIWMRPNVSFWDAHIGVRYNF